MLDVGALVGKYRVLRRLGEGGMGEVYLAEHTALQRTVAIKTLRANLCKRKGFVRRFLNEARIATQIVDPGIVQIFDYGEHEDGSAYIVMELLEGEGLDRRLRRLGRLEMIQALRLGQLSCKSLYTAHTKGIIHRDLKPGNIFIVADAAIPGGERTKILDFGIAKLPSEDITRTGVVIGTTSYMSPEQCVDAKAADCRSDIYSMGCVLMKMLTGHTPFEREDEDEILQAHLRELPVSASTHIAEIPSMIDEILLRCLAKLPDARFQTMIDLANALSSAERLISGQISATSIDASSSLAAQTPISLATVPQSQVSMLSISYSAPAASRSPSHSDIGLAGSILNGVKERVTELKIKHRRVVLAASAIGMLSVVSAVLLFIVSRSSTHRESSLSPSPGIDASQLRAPDSLSFTPPANPQLLLDAHMIDDAVFDTATLMLGDAASPEDAPAVDTSNGIGERPSHRSSKKPRDSKRPDHDGDEVLKERH